MDGDELMDRETKMGETNEPRNAPNATEHAEQAMVNHALGYTQIIRLAEMALGQIVLARNSLNPTRIEQALYDVEDILHLIRLQADEHRRNIMKRSPF